MEFRMNAVSMPRICCSLLSAAFLTGAWAATGKVPLKEGWKFVKADDPGYVCDANVSNEIRKLSSILDRAQRMDFAGAPVFAWAAPGFDDSSWKTVRVPHDWGVDKPFDSDLPYGDAFLDVTGIGWYRNRFALEGGVLSAGSVKTAVPNITIMTLMRMVLSVMACSSSSGSRRPSLSTPR